MKLIKNPYPTTQAVRGDISLDEQAKGFEKHIWEDLDEIFCGYRIKPEELQEIVGVFVDYKKGNGPPLEVVQSMVDPETGEV